MKKALKVAFYAVTVVQLVMAVIYFVCCASSMPLLEDNTIYIEAMNKGVYDEYTGFMYPVFLLLVYKPFGSMFLARIIQILLLCISIFLLTGIAGRNINIINRIAISLYAVSFPLTMHIGMQMLPDAICICFLLLWILGLSRDNKGAVIRILGFTGASLFSKKYFYIILFIWICYVVIAKVKKNIRLIRECLCIITALAISFGLSILLTTPGAYNRMPYTLSTGLMSTYAFEAFEADYTFWPYEADMVLPFEDVRYITFSRDYIITKMGPYFLENMSYQHADRLALGITVASLKMRSKESITRTFNNTIEYLLFPVTYYRSLNGDVKSLTAYRLFSFEGDAPFYAVRYIYISVALLCILVAMLLISKINDSKGGQADFLKNIGIIAWIMIAILGAVFGLSYFDIFLMAPVVIVIVAVTGRSIFDKQSE